MNEHDQLREQMWDLVYDLATPEEKAALCARIRSDPRVARLYAEVSLEADLIARAARVDDASVTLPEVEPQRERVAAGRTKATSAANRFGSSGAARWLHAVVAATALGLGGVLAFGTFWREETPLAQRIGLVNVYYAEPGPLVQGAPQRTLVVETKDADGNPASEDLKVRITSTVGKVVEEQDLRTDEAGRAPFVVKKEAIEPGLKLQILRQAKRPEVPAAPAPVPARLEDFVDPTSELLMEEILPVEPEPIRTQVTFDKDWYDAGDEVRFRAFATSAFTHKLPDPDALAFRLIGPDNRPLEPADSMALEGTGIVTGEFRLPPDAPAGRYAFAIVSPSHGEQKVEANVVVGRDATGLHLDQSSLRGPLGGGLPAGFGGGGFEMAPGGRGGSAPVEMRPEKHELAARSDVRTKISKGVTPGQSGRLASPAAPAQSETPAPGSAGGVADPSALKRAADTKSRSEVERLAVVDEKQLGEHGQEDKFVRQAGKTLDVAIPAELASKPLKIEVRYQDVLLGKQVVSPPADRVHDKLAEAAADGRISRTVGVLLEPWVDGELELTYSDNSTNPPQPLLTQRVVTPNQFDVLLQNAKDVYGPGDKVQFLVQVKDRVEQVIPNLSLGLSVRPALSDERELIQQLDKGAALLERSQPSAVKGGSGAAVNAKGDPSAETARRKQESNEQSAGDARKKSDAEAPQPAPLPAVNSASPPSPAPDASDAPPPAANRSLNEVELSIHASEKLPKDGGTLETYAGVPPASLSGESRSQVVVSNREQVELAVKQREQARAARKAQLALWRVKLGKVLLFGGVLMLVVLGIAVAIHRPAKVRVWLIPLGIAAASFAVGIVWVLGQPRHSGQEVAARRSDKATRAGGGEASESMRSMTTRAPGAPRAMDHESESAPTSAGMGPVASAPSQAPVLDGQPASGSLAEGLLTESAGETEGDLLQRRFAKSRSAQAAGGENRPAPADDVANSKPASPPGKASGTSDKPAADAKRESPPRELERGLDGAGDRVAKEARKPRPEVSAKTMAAPINPAKPENKQTQELSKNGHLAGRPYAPSEKAEVDEAQKVKDGKKQVHTIVWQPLIAADENGRALVEFTMPEVPGEYRLVLDVHGLGRIGRIEQKIRCEVQPAARAAEAKP